MDTIGDAISWYLVLMAVTWAVAPAVALLCGELADRGAGIARPVGLLVTVLPMWWLASLGLTPYSTAGLWVTVAAVAVASYAVAVRRGVLGWRWLRAMLVAEVVGIAAFALYVWFRGHQPAIVQTEKPMDSLMLASSIRTEEIPPPDPWFAGEPINYYYLGYLLNGAVARMAGVAEGIAFNLALAGTFAASVVAATSVGFNVVRRFAGLWRAVAAGAAGATLVVWAGNTRSIVDFLREPAFNLDEWWWAGIGWNSSRVIDDGSPFNPISEFPAFSFVLGDLHPHVMALPFALMALGLAANLALRAAPRGFLVTAARAGREPLPGGTVEPVPVPVPVPLARAPRVPWLTVAATGTLIGSLYALNSWDLPTYGLIAAIATFLALTGAPLRTRLLGVVTLGVAAIVAWLPFFVSFSPPLGASATDLPGWLDGIPIVSTVLTTLAPVTGPRTDLGDYLGVFAVPTVIAIVFLALSLAIPRRSTATGLRSGEVLAIVAALVVMTFLTQTPVPLVAGLIVTAAIEVARREGAVTPRSIAAGLFALGYLLTVVTEIVFVRDVFDARMNTIFKVQYQVWVMFGIASAIGATVIWADATRLRGSLRGVVRPAVAVAAVVAVLLTSIYPVVAGERYSVVYEQDGWTGLDGQALARTESPDEMAGIDWLRANAAWDSRVLEAVGCAYGSDDFVPANPVSAYTGFSTLMGWTGHERQWRNGVEPDYGEIGERADQVRRLYADPAAAMAAPVGFDYVFIGEGERDGFPQAGGADCAESGPYAIDDAAFVAAGWRPVFQRGDVVIYGRGPA